MSAPRREETTLARWTRPGTLVYFGGGVHEVLGDGVTARFRADLAPNSPRSLWRPRWLKGRRR